MSASEALIQYEADYLADCMLMPESMVRVEVAKLGDRIDLLESSVVNKLANHFGVSLVHMGRRLVELYNLNP